jgi:hypothetical protein
MAAMAPGRISATTRPGSPGDGRGGRPRPPGLRRDRVAVDLEENEVPLGEIAPAFESTVSRMHLLAPAIWL